MDTLPGPISIEVATQIPAADTNFSSGCDGRVTTTPVTVDGVSGTRNAEGPCTSSITYLTKGTDVYYLFRANGLQYLLDYHRVTRSNTPDLTPTVDTMVMSGLEFSA